METRNIHNESKRNIESMEIMDLIAHFDNKDAKTIADDHLGGAVQARFKELCLKHFPDYVLGEQATNTIECKQDWVARFYNFEKIAYAYLLPDDIILFRAVKEGLLEEVKKIKIDKKKLQQCEAAPPTLSPKIDTRIASVEWAIRYQYQSILDYFYNTVALPYLDESKLPRYSQEHLYFLISLNQTAELKNFITENKNTIFYRENFADLIRESADLKNLETTEILLQNKPDDFNFSHNFIETCSEPILAQAIMREHLPLIKMFEKYGANIYGLVRDYACAGSIMKEFKTPHHYVKIAARCRNVEIIKHFIANKSEFSKVNLLRLLQSCSKPVARYLVHYIKENKIAVDPMKVFATLCYSSAECAIESIKDEKLERQFVFDSVLNAQNADVYKFLLQPTTSPKYKISKDDAQEHFTLSWGRKMVEIMDMLLKSGMIKDELLHDTVRQVENTVASYNNLSGHQVYLYGSTISKVIRIRAIFKMYFPKENEFLESTVTAPLIPSSPKNTAVAQDLAAESSAPVTVVSNISSPRIFGETTSAAPEAKPSKQTLKLINYEVTPTLFGKKDINPYKEAHKTSYRRSHRCVVS